MPKHQLGAKVTWDGVGAGAPAKGLCQPGGARVPPAATPPGAGPAGTPRARPRQHPGLANL